MSRPRVLAVLAALAPLALLLVNAPANGLALPSPAAAGPREAAEPVAWSGTVAGPDADRPRTVEPRAFLAYRLDRGALLDELGTGLVEVPDPDGALVSFRVAPTSLMEDELAAAHPELQSWSGSAVDGGASIHLDVTPGGVHASVRGDGPAWYVDPAYRDGGSLHLS